MRRAASKCRPADVSLNGYRTPDPLADLGTKSASRWITISGVRPGGYDRAARPSLDPRRCPRGWRHTESRRARDRPAARRARAAPRPTSARPSDSEGAFRAAGDVRRGRRADGADRRDRGGVRRRPRRVHPRLRHRRAQDADRRAAGRRRRALATRQATPARGRPAARGIPPGPSRRRRGGARRGSPRVHRRHAAATRRRRRAVPRGGARGARLRPEGGRGRHDRSRGALRQGGHRVLPRIVARGGGSARQRRRVVGEATPALQPGVPRSRGGRLRDGHGTRRGGAAQKPVGRAFGPRLLRRFQRPHAANRRRGSLRRGRSRRARQGDQRRHQGGVRVLRKTIRDGDDRPGVGPDTR